MAFSPISLTAQPIGFDWLYHPDETLIMEAFQSGQRQQGN